MQTHNIYVLRLSVLAAASVMLLGFGDAQLAAPDGDASSILSTQAASSRMLLQAQQNKIVGIDSYDLTGGVRTRTKSV